MNFIKILFVGCYFALLEHSTFCEDMYKVTNFRGITAVQNNNGTIPYIEKHPDANTEVFSEERRLELCREGLKRVQLHEPSGIDYIFLENTETKKMKAYVLVKPPSPDVSDIFSDDIVEVRPAYMCPTSPPTYIHVDRDQPDTTIFWVIFKERGPIFTFSQITNYQLQTPEGVEEATVEQLSQAEADFFSNSGFDTDILTESQRLYMCHRGMNIAPEIGLVADEKCTNWGTSKYYALSYSEASVDEDDTIRMYWQAFSCPTTPVMYIVTQGYKEDDDRTFWSIVKSSDVKRRPVPNIIGYKLVIVHALVGAGDPIPKGEKLEPKSASSHLTKDNKSPLAPKSPHSQTSGSEISSPFEKRLLETAELLNAMTVALDNATDAIDRLQPKKNGNPADQLQPRESEKPTDRPKGSENPIYRLQLKESENLCKQINTRRGQAAIDTNRLKNEELLHICSKAISTVFGKNARFTSGAAGRRQFYCYKHFIKSSDTIPSDERVEAFRCPTKPEIFVHIGEPVERSTYVAHVLIKKDDLALQFMQ